MRWTNKSTRGRSALLTVATFAVIAASTQASHWSMGGHDAGRSSHQVSDPAQLPLPHRCRTPEVASGTSGTVPDTSPIVTGGATLADQRIVYGFAGGTPPGGSTQMRVVNFGSCAIVDSPFLDDDAPLDPDNSYSPDSVDEDGWGPPEAPMGVTPMSASSGHADPGMIYAVYNDDNAQTNPNTTTGNVNQNYGRSDIQLAQVNPVDGSLIADRSLAPGGPTNPFSGLDGFTIMSPPVMSADQGNGDRLVAFTVAASQDGPAPGADVKKLAIFTIPNAHAPGSHAPTGLLISGDIPDLNPFAAPTFVNLREPGGSRQLHVMVATTNGLKSWRYNNLGADGAGPSISGLGKTWTPSVPVRQDGSSPSTIKEVSSSTTSFSPYVYVASGTETTVVRRIKQDESDIEDPEKLKQLIVADETSVSPEFAGAPSASLSVTQTIPTAGPTMNVPQPGRVVVATAKNIYSLDTDNLSDASPPKVFKTDIEKSGFSLTQPVTSGNLGFITDDDGDHFAFLTEPDETGSMRVEPDETGFAQNGFALNATASKGHPAVSRGRVVFQSNNGIYTYGSNVAITRPAQNGAAIGPAVTLGAYAYNPAMTSVAFLVDGTLVDTDIINDDREFTVTFDSLSVLDGPHTLVAVASNGIEEENETSAPRTFIVNNFVVPNAKLTVGPNPANPDTNVTLDASGSTPTDPVKFPKEAGETITRWAFEIDGDNDFDDIVELASQGGDGRVTRTFPPGTYSIGVRITDSHGDVAQTTAPLRVNAPPAANLVVGPNPAAEGQEVTVDAGGSTDADGSIAKYEFDLDGDGSFELDQGSNPKVQRVFGPGTTKISMRVTDNEGASSIVSATLVVNAKPANQIPVATFKVSPNPADRDQRVLFDATGAVDPDGLITKYEWDLDDNGTFETNSQNNPRVQRSYSTAKIYNVKLRVTDNLGAVSTVFTGTLTIKGVGRKTPRRLTAKVTPMRDALLPFDFRTTGKLTRPSGVSKKAGCSGRVTVSVKAGKKTISRRTTKLRSNCTYRTSVRFRDRNRMGRSNALRFTARFQGNKALRARQATTVRVRLG